MKKRTGNKGIESLYESLWKVDRKGMNWNWMMLSIYTTMIIIFVITESIFALFLVVIIGDMIVRYYIDNKLIEILKEITRINNVKNIND